MDAQIGSAFFGDRHRMGVRHWSFVIRGRE
jgi:hypothetical protein